LLESVVRRISAAGFELATSRLNVAPNAPADELLGSIGAAISKLSGRSGILLLVDGYSDKSVQTARLFMEMWNPRPHTAIFMIPPLPYEKRLEKFFRFNVGLMANWLNVDGILVNVELGDGTSLHEASSTDLEESIMGRMSAALSDFLRRSDRPPLSELLEDGGNYLLMVGGFKDAKDMALVSALEGTPSVAVIPSSSVSELVMATTLANALGVGIDAVSGGTEGVNYIVMRRDLRQEDPIYTALSGHAGGAVPALDMEPTLPARVEIPLDLYEL
jgi:hypothetical protein